MGIIKKMIKDTAKTNLCNIGLQMLQTSTTHFVIDQIILNFIQTLNYFQDNKVHEQLTAKISHRHPISP